MSKIVLKSLSILLGAFFIFLGALKVTPKISRDLHKDLRTEYAKYAKAFPLAKQLDFKVSSKWLRRGVGATEILAGVVLLAVPHRLTKVWAPPKQSTNPLLFEVALTPLSQYWTSGVGQYKMGLQHESDKFENFNRLQIIHIDCHRH